MGDSRFNDGFIPNGISRIVLRYKYILRVIITLVVGMALLGCGRDILDLQQYVEDVKARKSYKIDPLPEVKPYKSFEYQAENLRDPFDSNELSVKLTKKNRPLNSGLSPDPNRTAEYLETFPLDALRMVGTLSQGNALWALIRTPDSTIQRVTEGNYMGQNYGKIVEITDEEIYLTEIIPDGFGGWRGRAGAIALKE
ncbi:MAG: pilus assembly protein PilP [Pseudomonadota bacterium]